MKPEDDDLDADLRALFADQRLSVPAGEDAVSSVVAGARRRRRRRTAVMATGGALGVAAVLLAGGLFAGHVIRPGSVQTAHQPGLTTSRYQTSTPDQPSTAPQLGVIGPDGYGDLALSMTAQQALATKLVDSPGRTVNGCTAYSYAGPAPARPSATSAQARSLYVYVSVRGGVQAIVAPPGVTTPEGIGPGSSSTALKTAYPKGATQKGELVLVPVPDHPGVDYRFTVDGQGTVATVGLSLTSQTCVK